MIGSGDADVIGTDAAIDTGMADAAVMGTDPGIATFMGDTMAAAMSADAMAAARTPTVVALSFVSSGLSVETVDGSGLSALISASDPSGELVKILTYSMAIHSSPVCQGLSRLIRPRE